MTKKLDIVVGLSGGVDSSVAAWLLQQKGHKVRAVFMKNWDSDNEGGDCSSKEDFLSAATAADKLNIPLEFVSFSSSVSFLFGFSVCSFFFYFWDSR